jgi:hypothetical protein
LAGFQSHSLKSVVVDYAGMTIEHLVSQSETGKNGFTEEIVGQLGNLILVPPELNARLASKTFKEKKRILKSAGVSIPPEFANLDEITPTAIQARTGNLADQAYKQVWKI